MSWRGLFHVHVMRMGGEVDMEGWIQKVLDEGGQVEAFYKYEEEELGLWHLRLYWRRADYTGRRFSVTPQPVQFSGTAFPEGSLT